MKTHARVAIVGGGIFGVSLAYHLTKEGWSDVVLLEKGELTSGSTWHAAGQVPHFISSLSMAKIHDYGTRLYPALEAETGQSAGWHGCGGIRLASTAEELDWFHYVEGVARLVGFELHIIGPDEIRRLHPFLDTFGVVAGAHTVADGHVDPTSTTNAMAIGARRGGAEINRHTRVTGIEALPSGEWKVISDKGEIICEHVVNAAGSYGAQVGAWVGLQVPIVNMVHHYLVTEPLAEVKALERELPVVRDPYSSCYLRQEQSGLLIGPYETEGARACFLEGVPWSFDMELLQPELDRLTPWLERASERLPLFARAGIRRIIAGAITHTPDGNFLLGPAPGRRNVWMACGASIGICQGGGAGKYLAQWMVHGQAEINMREFDPRRFGDWATGDYALAKALDEYQEMYALHAPGEHRDAGRPLRTTPLYRHLKEKGAVYAEVFGWERPKWFSRDGAAERYSFRRSNWFEAVGGECRAVRERVGVLDLSSFAKFEVSGADAAAVLDRLLANRLPRRPGGIALAHLLTADGMIESELTVTRLGPERFYLVSAAAAQLRDRDFLAAGIGPAQSATVSDVTDDYGVLVLAGPRAREVLAPLTRADLSNATFPWLTAQEIEVAEVPVRALRVNYVGELGWELHVPMADLGELYHALMAAGAEYGIADFGAYAVNALRLEKAYRGWGSELTNEITPLDAGLERFVAFDKGHFVGRDALLRRRANPATRLVYLAVDVADAEVLGNEPVYAGARLVGVTTAGAYGYSVGTSLAFAYVDPTEAEPETALEIRILGAMRPARVLAQPAYDPVNLRLRA